MAPYCLQDTQGPQPGISSLPPSESSCGWLSKLLSPSLLHTYTDDLGSWNFLPLRSCRCCSFSLEFPQTPGLSTDVAPLQRLWGRSWPDSFLGLPWLRGKSKVTGVGGVGDLRHTKSGLAIPQRPLCYRWGDIMTAGREHGCPAPSFDLPGLLGHAHSRVQSALESSRLKFKA